jgi:IS5 family transposase
MAGGSECTAEIAEDSAEARLERFRDSLPFSTAICLFQDSLSKNGTRRDVAKLLETMEKGVLCRIAWNFAVFG